MVSMVMLVMQISKEKKTKMKNQRPRCAQRDRPPTRRPAGARSDHHVRASSAAVIAAAGAVPASRAAVMAPCVRDVESLTPPGAPDAQVAHFAH